MNPAINRRVTWLIGQIIALLLCLAYVQYIYVSNIFPDIQAKALFKKTECFIISKQLSTKGRVMQRYRSDFLVSYNVDGVQYRRWLSGNGLDSAYGKDQSNEEDVLSQFDVGGTYTCWYNPDDPASALLIWRHDWQSTIPMIVPIVLGLIIVYYFFKNIFISLFGLKNNERKNSQH